MFEAVPGHIIRKLLEHLPSQAKLMAMHTDYQGNLLGWYGNGSYYFEDALQRGKPVSVLLPYLEGVFPLPQQYLELPRLQFSEEKWINVFVLLDHDRSHWVFISDCSGQTVELQGLLQKINEKKLQMETVASGARNNPFGKVHLLQMATFEKLSYNRYALCGTPPDWLSTLKPAILHPGIVKLFDHFPFLEVFEQEMIDEQVEEGRKFYNSGIWIETDGQEREYFLRAFLTEVNQKTYLLIRLLNNDLLGEHDTIQKAREQQLAYEQMTKAKKALKEILDYKDKFVSIITHDLRSPIASVLGATEMLLNDTEFVNSLDLFNKEMLLSMRDEMTRMLDYNDKLYFWSNLELGNFKLVKENIKVGELMAIVQKTFKNKFKEKGISFSTRYAVNDTLKVDVTLFLQVLNNLVGNALKFTPEGGTIHMEYYHDAQGKRLKVSDTGGGMPEEKAAHLFDHLSSDSTLGTQGEKGSGLGLGIVKRIVEAHHFKITARSKPGQGTEITLEL